MIRRPPRSTQSRSSAASDVYKRQRQLYPDLDESRTAHEIVRRQITAMVEDVIVTTQKNLDGLSPKSCEDVRSSGTVMVSFSGAMAKNEKAIKAFLFKHLYRAPQVMVIRENAQQIVGDLFNVYFCGDAQMPNEWGLDWKDTMARLDEARRARLVCDFLAGMTDRYAVLAKQRLFD